MVFSGLMAESMALGSPNLGQGSTWMMSWSTLKIKVIGQKPRSPPQVHSNSALAPNE